MSQPLPSLETETQRMERILASPTLGIAYQDGLLYVQEFDDDPLFRELVEEFFRQRIHQRFLAQQSPTKQYPLLAE